MGSAAYAPYKKRNIRNLYHPPIPPPHLLFSRPRGNRMYAAVYLPCLLRNTRELRTPTPQHVPCEYIRPDDRTNTSAQMIETSICTTCKRWPNRSLSARWEKYTSESRFYQMQLLPALIFADRHFGNKITKFYRSGRQCEGGGIRVL